jgi:mannose-6-phosphate isomerase-like protein (cupin superfamily)
MAIYHLPVGGTDPQQHPHSADEIYVVLAGRATLEVEGETLAVDPGKVSVDIGADHRFLDVTEDLQVLVVFAPPDDPGACHARRRTDERDAEDGLPQRYPAARVLARPQAD